MSKGRNPVVIFMRDIGLPQYTDTLLRDGFDDMETLLEIEERHLKDMGFLPGHAVKLKKRLRDMETNSPLQAAALRSSTAKLGLHKEPMPMKPNASGVQVMPVLPSPLGLSKEVIDVAQRSWQQLRPSVGTIAEAFYKNMFILNPASKKLFSMTVRNRHRDWTSPREEADHNFENSTALRELFSKMVCAVGSAVMGLHNPGKVIRDLTAIGMRHVGYAVQEEYFTAFGQALLLAFRGHCSLLTPEADQAWIAVFDFVSTTVVRGLQAAKAEEASVQTKLASESTKTLLGSRHRAPGKAQTHSDAKFSPPLRPREMETFCEKAISEAPVAHPVGVVPCSGTINTVQQSWMVVKELGVANIGEIMYKHLFKIAPVTKQLFPVSVRNRHRDWSCSEEEVEDVFDNSPALRNLFAKVVEAVGSAVAGLHNISRLVAELNALGMRHLNYNMREEFFEYGGQALVLTLKDGLGEALTQDVQQAWVAVYEFISACIISGLRFAQEKESLVKRLQHDCSSQSYSPQSLNSYVSQNVSVSTKCSDDTPPLRRGDLTLPIGKGVLAGR